MREFPAGRLLISAVLIFTVGVAVMPGVSGAPGTAGQRDGRVTLGVLRADGILLPFASFTGSDWRVAWPTDLTGRELPTSVDSVPRSWWGGAEPTAWRVFDNASGGPRPVTPLSLVAVRIGAETRVGLRTDQKPQPADVPPAAVPFPKIGLAVSGPVEVTPITINTLTGETAWQFLQPIRSSLNAAEDRTLSALSTNTGWKHPVDKVLRTRLEPQLEAWYSTSFDGGARLSYIEVAKKYPPGPDDDGCGLETLITGWVHQSGKPGRPPAELRARVMYCDRETASYMLPFGQISLRNRIYWVFQMSGQDHEWYAVAEAAPGRVRLVAEYLAGGFRAR